MYNSIALACGLVVMYFATRVYFRYRDAFHPAVFTAPLMIAGFSVWPLILNRNGDLESLIGTEYLVRVQVYYLLGLFFLYFGMAWRTKAVISRDGSFSAWQSLKRTIGGERARQRLVGLSLLLATVASLAFWNGIANVGGFDAAYSEYKGGGRSGSGYLGEASLLAYPAVLMYSISRQGRGFRLQDWVLILIMVSPNLIQGTFGVRRGPLFISLSTLFISWIVARGRLPGLFRTGVGVGVVSAIVGFMWSQRKLWFSEEGSDTESGFASTLIPTAEMLSQNDFVSGVGNVVLTDYYDAFVWGKRWLVDLVIRPIPRQIWPTKYADVGADWKTGLGGTMFSEVEQVHALGFPLPAGHSVGMLSDLYTEWWWFALVVLFAFGFFLRWLWVKHRTVGQIWTVIFLSGIGLCIYLPTQSFSAWYHRFLVMAVGTFISWRWIVGRDVRSGVGGRGPGRLQNQVVPRMPDQ
jgi:hypothetical protein